MVEFRRCMFIVLNAVARFLVVSGTGNNVKHVCQGDPVLAFQNIDFDPCNASVSLNINGERNVLIANWLIKDCIQNATLTENYEGRVFLNANRTITLQNFHDFDQGKYIVVSKKDTLPFIEEVQIDLMIAPRSDCKPTINRLGNTLVASIEPDKCGTPVSTPYWKGYNIISDTDKITLKIAPGHEDRSYEACIKSISLQCATNRNEHDHCSTFVIKGITTETLESVKRTTGGYFTSTVLTPSADRSNVDIIVLASFLTLSASVHVIMSLILWTYKRRLEYTKSMLSNEQQRNLPKYYKSLPVISCCTDKSKPHSKGQLQDSEIPLQQCGPEQQPCVDQKLMTELSELRDQALCKICYQNKISVLFRPCNHVVTCSECNLPNNECPVCRTKIEETLNVRFSDVESMSR